MVAKWKAARPVTGKGGANKGTNANRAIREEKAKKAPTPPRAPKAKKAAAPKRGKKK